MIMTYFVRHPNVAKAIALCICIANLTVVQISNPPIIPRAPNLDIAWVASLPEMLDQGQISGRDFYFTYGVLTQVVNWFATYLTLSHSSLLAFSTILLILSLIGWGLVSVILWLHPTASWKTVVFTFLALLVMGIDWSVIRTAIALVLMTALARALSMPRSWQRVTIAALTGLLIVIGQLVILDLAIYAIISSAAILTGYALLTRLPTERKRPDLLSAREYLFALATLLAAFIIGNVIVSVIFKMTSAHYQNIFDYQRYGLESLRGYNLSMGVKWEMTMFPTFGLFMLAGFCLIWLIQNWKGLDQKSVYLFSCWAAPAFLMIKSAIVRADLGHILLGFQALVFLFIMIGSYLFETQRMGKTWLLMAVMFLAIWPNTSLSFLHTLARIADNPQAVLSSAQQYFAQSATQEQLLPENFPATLVDENTPVLAFPYENDTVVILGNPLVAPVLQTYAAHTTALQRYYISRIEEIGPELKVIYGMDGVVSAQIDNVQHVSRVPIIFEYIYRNFELDSPQVYGGGFYLLNHRSQSRDLPAPLSTAPDITQNGLLITITNTTASACSLLKLTIEIDYPIWSLVGRLNPLQVRVSQGDNLFRYSNLVPIETGREFTTYISLIEPAQFYQVFGDGGAPVEYWDTIDIMPFPTGLFGVDPNSIELSEAGCIQL
jgi:hypothetical protein